MAVPRNRHSNARKNKKKAHLAKKLKKTIKCSSCLADILPHRLCSACGHYKKKLIVASKA